MRQFRDVLRNHRSVTSFCILLILWWMPVLLFFKVWVELLVRDHPSFWSSPLSPPRVGSTVTQLLPPLVAVRYYKKEGHNIIVFSN